MTYQEIINRVAQENNLSPELVGRTYRAFFSFIRNYIQSLPLKENLSEEDFNVLKTNFNIPSLGKLTCTYERMLNVKKRFEYINKLRNEYKEN